MPVDLTDVILGGIAGWLLSAKGPRLTKRAKAFLKKAQEEGHKIRTTKAEEKSAS